MFDRVLLRGYVGLGTVTAAVLMCSGAAYGQDKPADDLLLVRSEIERLRQEEQERALRIEDLENRLQAMEAAAGLTGSTILPNSAQDLLRGRNVGPHRAYMPADLGIAHYGARPVIELAQTTPAQDTPDRRAPAPTQAVETITQQEQGLFGERLSFEVGSTYSHFDDARLSLSGFLALDAIFLGRISVDEVTSDVWTVDGTARYRLGQRAQIDVNVPFLDRRSNFRSGGAGGNAAGLAERTVVDRDIGDVSAGISYRLFPETTNWPDVVVNARIKAPTGRDSFGVPVVEVPGTEGNLVVPTSLPTGSGVWSGSAGVSLLKTLDPLIVFANMTYFYAPETHFDDIDEAEGEQPGDVDLGEAVQFGAGVAFALNERSSLSFSYTQRIGGRATIARDEGLKRPVVGSQSNVASFNFGASFALTRKISLLTSLGIGLTSDAPDLTFGVRLPFSF